jgi:hypothetical protein
MYRCHQYEQLFNMLYHCVTALRQSTCMTLRQPSLRRASSSGRRRRSCWQHMQAEHGGQGARSSQTRQSPSYA